MTPGADTGTVDVSVTSSGKGGSTVSIVYQLTALIEAGNKKLAESLNEYSYAAMMDIRGTVYLIAYQGTHIQIGAGYIYSTIDCDKIVYYQLSFTSVY